MGLKSKLKADDLTQEPLTQAQAQAEAPKVTVADLEKAAELLLSQLPEHAEELVREQAKDMSLDLWHVVDGLILEAYSHGSIALFTLDPSWEHGLMQREYECRYCHKPFKPIAIGQLYCSNACGLLAVSKPEVEPQLEENLNRDSDFIDELDSPGAGYSSAGAGWSGASERALS